MKLKLKNCPFCGGKAEIQQFAHPKNYAYVECTECLCKTDGHRYSYNDKDFKENAKRNAEVWNRREGISDENI